MGQPLNCYKCNLTFTKKSNRECQNVHDRKDVTYQCPFCKRQRKNLCDLRYHLRCCHPKKKELVQAKPWLIKEVYVSSSMEQQPHQSTPQMGAERAKPFQLDESIGLSPAVQENLARYVESENQRMISCSLQPPSHQ